MTAMGRNGHWQPCKGTVADLMKRRTPLARWWVVKHAFVLCASLLCACARLSSAPVPLLPGEWGGSHVGLSLTSTGGTLEYDCAAGTMAVPVTVHPDGTFTAEGTHTPGWGGPEIQGQVMPTYRVRYSGKIRGDVMSLQGRVENGVLLGPFELRRGAEAIIFRCV